MKKPFLIFLLSFVILQVSKAQMLCVQCFEQNDSIGLNVGTNNFIINGGFESTNCATNCIGVYCPSASNTNCSIENWICSGGGTLTYGCVYDSSNYLVPQGARAVYFGNSYSNACSGTASSTFPNNDTACLIHTGCTITGIPAGYPLSAPNYGNATGVTLTQTVNGLTPGNIYVLEFWAGGEYEGWFSKNGMFAVDVGFERTFLKCKITHQHPDIGTRYLIQFIAASTSHTIKFTNWGHICGACTELVLDDVRLYPSQYLPSTIPICSSTVNVNELPKKEITVFPNPVVDKLTVKTNNNESSEISIYNMFSQKQLQQSFVNSIIINTQSLTKGIYLYEIKNTGKTTRGKIVKD